MDAFEEKDSEKNAGKEIGTGRGGSGGDDEDSRTSAPPGGRPAMDADEPSGAVIFFVINGSVLYVLYIFFCYLFIIFLYYSGNVFYAFLSYVFYFPQNISFVLSLLFFNIFCFVLIIFFSYILFNILFVLH